MDSKFFARSKALDLQRDLLVELRPDKRSVKHTKMKQILKKIIANMTMGNDMTSLASEILNCMAIQDIEIKKLTYLYIITYCRYKSELALLAINFIIKVSLRLI